MSMIMGNPFAWLLAMIALVAAYHGLRAFLGYRQIARDAEAEYSYQVSEGMVPDGIDEPMFVRAYRRANSPRGNAYIAATMGIIIGMTYPAFVILQVLLEQFWFAIGRNEVFEPGFLVWKFLIFFGMLATWVTIAFLMARRFHSRAPISFKRELEKESGLLL